MLKTLENLDQKTVRDVLSSLTMNFLPNPKKSIALSELQEEVLKEIQQELGLKSDDYSNPAKAKILDYLSNKMSEHALGKTKLDLVKIKADLGQKGDLRSDLYEIKFTDLFYEISSQIGIKRRDVVDVLKQPDIVDHLFRGDATSSVKASLSLYLKSFVDPKNRENYFLLVQTQRKDYIQAVSSAWKIYHSDVDLSNTQTALDVLCSFTEKYGFSLQVGNKYKEVKFILYENIPFVPGTPFIIGHDKGVKVRMGISPFRQLMTEIEGGKGIRFTSMGEMRISPLGILEVSVAYIINITKYHADLKKHGIKIKKK